MFTKDRTSPEPYPKQSAWEFYRHVKDHIAYLHIKDGRWDAEAGKAYYTFAGQGDTDVRRIVKHMLDEG